MSKSKPMLIMILT